MVERPGGLTFTLRRIAGDEAWQDVLPAWRSFAHGPDVDGGFWCQPDVLFAFEASAGLGELLLVTVQRDGAQVAVIPFRLERKPVPVFIGLWRVATVRATLARLFDYEFCAVKECGRLELLDGAASCLAQDAACDLVLGQNCLIPETGARPLLKGCAWRNVQPSYLAELPVSFDAFLEELSSKSRQTLKRKMRKAEDECGRLQLLCRTASSEMAELSRQLQDIWRRSWHGRLGRQRPPPVDVLQGLAEQGLVRAYVLLDGGDTPMASVLGYVWNGVYYDEAPAYDERCSKLSPGLLLNYFIIKDLIEHDAASRIDFGFGYNQYKQVLGNRRIERGNLWMPLTVRGRRVVGVMRLGDCGYRAGKRIMGRTGLDRWIKRRLQGQGKAAGQ